MRNDQRSFVEADERNGHGFRSGILGFHTELEKKTKNAPGARDDRGRILLMLSGTSGSLKNQDEGCKGSAIRLSYSYRNVL